MEDRAPISLYFALEEGEMPDLAVIAKATLAWNDLIREVVFVVDPSAEVRVEFLSGTIGSRSINSYVRTAWKVATEHPWTAGPLAAVAGVFLLAVPNHLADDATRSALQHFLGHEDDALSPNDVDRIAKAVVDMERNQCAIELRREVYRQAQREPVICGIGSTRLIGSQPSLIIPRSEFQKIAGGDQVILETAEKKTTWKRDYAVTIIRSYSKAEERRWRFEHGGDEFSATMKDPEFLAAIKSGHTGVEIGEGVEMRIDLRIKEEKIDGVWHVKDQDVMHVVYPVTPTQISLKFTTD